MLVTVTGRAVRPYGVDDQALPETGAVRFAPAMNAVHDGALVSKRAVHTQIVAGSMVAVELVPGPWRVTVSPHSLGGEFVPPWPDFLIDLDPSDDPVDLATVAPVVVVDGEKWSRGPAGQDGEDGRDGTDGQDGRDGRDGRDGTDGQDGRDGHTPVLTWSDTALAVDGVVGPDLRGPQGEGGADGTDGVDGTDGRDGADGRDGNTGPPPAVSWSADRVTIGSETSPPLTGPAGPRPPTAWEGDRLRVSGELGPSLTGPASTVPGPRGLQGEPGAPGAVPTASSYLIVGPGRPDIAGNPLITGSEPSGCVYRSTNGPQGAWEWVKRGSAWVITSGDTGWFTVGENGARAWARLLTTQVRVYVDVLPSANTTIWSLPVEYRPAGPWGTAHSNAIPVGFAGRTNGVSGYLYFPEPGPDRLLCSTGAANNRARGVWERNLSQPWPASTPVT